MVSVAKLPRRALVRLVMLMAVGPGCVATRAGTTLDGGATSFALQALAEVALPGSSSRFDYQDIDSKSGHLIIAHMGDNAVDVLKLDDGSVVARVGNINTPRGIAVATEPHRIFVTSLPNQVVILDGDKGSRSLIVFPQCTSRDTVRCKPDMAAAGSQP